MKIQIHAPTRPMAASLAASLDLHLSQWEWVEHPLLYASLEPLFRARSQITVERIGWILRNHQPTTGMSVSMGVTCRCGYWTGNEVPGKTRPAGYSGLQWHQAVEIAKALKEEP